MTPDIERFQTSFAEAGIAAQRAAKQMAKLQKALGLQCNKAAQYLAYAVLQSERSAVDRLADLAREDNDGGT